MSNITEEEIFDFLCKKYVQRSDKRQQEMGLQYTEAETHDLAKELFRFYTKEYIQYKSGYYWVRMNPYKGRIQEPVILELSDMGNWFGLGYDGIIKDSEFTILDGPIKIPEGEENDR